MLAQQDVPPQAVPQQAPPAEGQAPAAAAPAPADRVGRLEQQIAGQFVVPIPDPCSVSSPQRTGPDQQQVEALCLAQGLPPALLPTYNFILRRVE